MDFDDLNEDYCPIGPILIPKSPLFQTACGAWQHRFFGYKHFGYKHWILALKLTIKMMDKFSMPVLTCLKGIKIQRVIAISMFSNSFLD